MSKFFDDYLAWVKTQNEYPTCGSINCGHDDCALGYFKRSQPRRPLSDYQTGRTEEARAVLYVRDNRRMR